MRRHFRPTLERAQPALARLPWHGAAASSDLPSRDLPPGDPMIARTASLLAAATLLPLTAHAQGAPDPAPPAGTPAPPAAPAPEAAPPAAAPEAGPAPEAAPAAGAETAPPGTTAPGETSDAVKDAAVGDSAVELPGQTYYLLGARYRGVVVPKFMMNLFGDGGRTVYVHSFGPEFGIRKDGFEYNFSAWFANYAMDDTPFKASDDPDQAFEVVNSKIKVIFLTADFLWTHDFSPSFGLNYGLGAGFGFVFGDLSRVQSRPPGDPADPAPRPGDPYAYVKCSSETQDGPGGYCGEDNDHYGDYKEASWADGGSKPIIYPWIVLQTGLRFKPSRNFVTRLDTGFGSSGFFFGLGLDYGL
jgi:hypothetical protein